MDYLARKTLSEARERRAEAPVKPPAPVPGPPAPKAKPKAPKPDTGALKALEAKLSEVLQAQALLAQSMAAIVETKKTIPTYTVRITSRDGNRNIKSLTVTPEQAPPQTRH